MTTNLILTPEKLVHLLSNLRNLKDTMPDDVQTLCEQIVDTIGMYLDHTQDAIEAENDELRLSDPFEDEDEPEDQEKPDDNGGDVGFSEGECGVEGCECDGKPAASSEMNPSQINLWIQVYRLCRELNGGALDGDSDEDAVENFIRGQAGRLALMKEQSEQIHTELRKVFPMCAEFANAYGVQELVRREMREPPKVPVAPTNVGATGTYTEAQIMVIYDLWIQVYRLCRELNGGALDGDSDEDAVKNFIRSQQAKVVELSSHKARLESELSAAEEDISKALIVARRNGYVGSMVSEWARTNDLSVENADKIADHDTILRVFGVETVPE